MITIKFDNLNISHESRILDIGCGEGRHTIRAAQENGSISTGADFDFSNLVTTKEKLEFHEKLDDLACHAWNLVCTDITNLPFQNQSFDSVICSEVLEHINDDSKAIEELIRILKKDHILAISVPRYFPEKICWALSDEYFNANHGHVRIYKKHALIKKIESAGATFISSYYAHSIHSPFWWLKCLLGPNRTDSRLVNLYHKLLVWDLMKKPKITHFIDKLFNPLFGKSFVLYFLKK